MDTRWIDELAAEVPDMRVLREAHQIKRFTTGIRFGQGSALAVFEPASLLAFWKILKAAVAADCIVICQAANTGITGGSTPDGDDYDREIVIISTLKLDTCLPLCDAQQALVYAGGTLYRLEQMLAPFGKNPHSVIGSSCIGASAEAPIQEEPITECGFLPKGASICSSRYNVPPAYTKACCASHRGRQVSSLRVLIITISRS